MLSANRETIIFVLTFSNQNRRFPPLNGNGDQRLVSGFADFERVKNLEIDQLVPSSTDLPLDNVDANAIDIVCLSFG